MAFLNTRVGVNSHRAPVAQMNRAVAFETDGRGFESLHARQSLLQVRPKPKSKTEIDNPIGEEAGDDGELLGSARNGRANPDRNWCGSRANLTRNSALSVGRNLRR